MRKRNLFLLMIGVAILCAVVWYSTPMLRKNLFTRWGTWGSGSFPDTVLATVGNQTLRQADLEAFLNARPPSRQEMMSPAKGKEIALHVLIERIQFMEAVYAQGVPRVQGRSPQETAAKEREIAFNYRKKLLEGELKINQRDIEEFYQAHKEQFQNRPLKEVQAIVQSRLENEKILIWIQQKSPLKNVTIRQDLLKVLQG